MTSPGSTRTPPTIYDVARAAGVSIASVSRVLNGGDRNPRPETRQRVLEAVEQLGFIPDGAARALSARLKEVVGVVFRRVPWSETSEDAFAEEAEGMQFVDVINRGIEVAAQRRGFDLLIRSVDVDGDDPSARILALARKSDGLILHDRTLSAEQLDALSRKVPTVTLVGTKTQTAANVRSDNRGAMQSLATHLVAGHGYRRLAYLGGHADSPDNQARQAAFAATVREAGGTCAGGPGWQGNYLAGGGARVINRLLAKGRKLPRAIACANDQTALGAMYALAQHGIDVPGEVAVTGFDDLPLARHLQPPLTTVRQPISELGATAFDLLYSMINGESRVGRDVVLPVQVIIRGSCGCPVPAQAGPPVPAAIPASYGLGPGLRADSHRDPREVE